MSRQQSLARPLLVICLALLVPAVPFLLLGEDFEARLQAWVQQDWSPRHRFWLIVLVLSLDIVLPVPSSGVSTYAGGTLGVLAGTAASWLGMSLAAVTGFALARRLGRPFADRFGGGDMGRLESVSVRYAAAMLVLTRALPLLAEGCVLLLGSLQVPWRRFVPPVIISNLVISATYAAFGAYFGQRHALPAAIAASVLIPLTLAIVVRQRLRSTP